MKRSVEGMNVLVFITDQERAVQHFPKGWAKKNLPGLQRLRRYGLSFSNACCNACMCSPSRASLLTGYFPAQHGVKWTLEENMPAPKYPQKKLPKDLPNIATVMAAAGYSTPFKGKFHLTKPANPAGKYVPEDVNQYGFQRWNPPDAGANQDPSQYGGGNADNDGRFMHDNGATKLGREGALEYLQSKDAKKGPFFLVVSLVNPHDVLGYPQQAPTNGYGSEWFAGDIKLPETVNEDLSTKPGVQKRFLKLINAGMGNLTPDQQHHYINFYGNLMRSSDRYLVELLDALEREGLFENTLIIKTADHGEMGLAHGGMRQKNFNFYEETLRVPLIYSNPKLFKRPKKSETMVSHVDFLPTLASLFKAPKSACADWQGVDYSSSILNANSKQVQDYTVFTYDDYQSGQPNPPYPGGRDHIISIREERYKLAKYYNQDKTKGPYEWEMYDLQKDPLERRNIGYKDYKRTKKQEAHFVRLRMKLEQVEKTRLKPFTGTS